MEYAWFGISPSRAQFRPLMNLTHSPEPAQASRRHGSDGFCDAATVSVALLVGLFFLKALDLYGSIRLRKFDFRGFCLTFHTF